MPDDTTNSEELAALAAKPKAKAKKAKKAKRVQAKKAKALEMPEALREHNKLSPSVFLRKAIFFLAQAGVLAADRKNLEARIRAVRQTFGPR